MWSNPAFLFLQEPLVHKQLSLITKTSLMGLDDSQLLHMDLFGLIAYISISGSKYCLVIVDDYSRFTWVFFLQD
jgi:hypothetical protein